jgi:hypothetical protein
MSGKGRYEWPADGPSEASRLYAADSVFHVLSKAAEAQRTLFGKRLNSAKSMFKAIDKDHSGSASAEEFSAALQRLDYGLDDWQLNALLGELDTNGDGRISCKEFVDALEVSRPSLLKPTRAHMSYTAAHIQVCRCCSARAGPVVDRGARQSSPPAPSDRGGGLRGRTC